MPKSLAELARSLDLGKSSVRNSHQILFICGGKLTDPGGTPESLRGTLIDRLRLKDPSLYTRVVLAEEAALWFQSQKHFSNLVDLEEHLASIATLILLIVESPGAIAELGAFSFIESLRRKLVAVLETCYEQDQSFIVNGPIKKLESDGFLDLGPYYFDEWLASPRSTSISSVLAPKVADKLIREIIEPALSRPPKTEPFDREQLSHRMLLLADIICLGGPLLLNEIIEFLEAFGFREEQLTRDEINKLLYLLEKVKLIERRRRGNNAYFVATNMALKFVEFRTVDGRPFNRSSFTLDIRKFQQSLTSYDHRLAVFKSASGKRVAR